jgi:xylan 1,4-beta-xylosidase
MKISLFVFSLFKGAFYNPTPSYGHPVPFQTPSVTTMLNQITSNLNIINKYSTLNNVPVFVDECDPVVGYRYGIYDNSNYIVCNTEYYPSIVASIIYNILLLSSRIKLITTSAFYLDGKRMFEGNRMLVTNYNIYLPILNGLKLIEKLKTNKLSIEITNNTIPLNGFCTIDEINSDVQLLLFSHIDDYTFNANQNLKIIFNNIKLKYVLVKHYKIDVNNNNTYSEWVKMGKPDYLNDQQLAYFQSYQQLTLLNPPTLYEIENNTLILDSLNILAHSVDFFEIINLN